MPYTLDLKLVRGLDYYRGTTFEYRGGTLDSAQNALGGGGRYDGLVADLGGPDTPGVGFAIGLDRPFSPATMKTYLLLPAKTRTFLLLTLAVEAMHSLSVPNCALVEFEPREVGTSEA